MDYRQEYEKWCNDPYFDDDTKAELKALAGDEKENEKVSQQSGRHSESQHICK